MNLRSYLRGIGLGILVSSALFISIGFNKKSDLTDTEIKARAKELGMTEKTVLSDLSEEEIDSVKQIEETVEESTEEIVEESTEEIVEESIGETVEESIEESSEQSEANETAGHTEAIEYVEIDPSVNESVENISIIVNKGDGSGTVSSKLREAGLIEDADEFDHFLMENGYDRKITTGEHKIPSNATREQMAKILCN